MVIYTSKLDYCTRLLEDPAAVYLYNSACLLHVGDVVEFLFFFFFVSMLGLCVYKLLTYKL